MEGRGGKETSNIQPLCIGIFLIVFLFVCRDVENFDQLCKYFLWTLVYFNELLVAMIKNYTQFKKKIIYERDAMIIKF